MSVISSVTVFLFGLIFGSFANVLLVRFQTGESLLRRGSRCFSCSRRLRWFDLIPLFSYAALRGTCRSCKSKISIRYPLVEFGTGLLFLLLFLNLDFGFDLSFGFWNLPFWVAAGGMFSALFFSASWYVLWISVIYDLRHMILPDRLLAFALLFSIIALVIGNYSLVDIAYQVGAALLAFLFFFSLWLISRGRWMGLGDAKLIFVFGFLLSPYVLLVGIVFSFLLGSVIGGILLAFKKAHMKTPIPFGPFLFAGALVSFLAGDQIVKWYMMVFL